MRFLKYQTPLDKIQDAKSLPWIKLEDTEYCSEVPEYIVYLVTVFI